MRRKRGSVAVEAVATNERRAQLFAAAKEFKEFLPARVVMKKVRAVPTRFVQLDHAMGVGGLPIERFGLVHGPSVGGKSYLCLGLVESFLSLDHMGLYIDAERTTPITWVEQIMGELSNHPGFHAYRPTTYEETVEKVARHLTTLARLRAAGKLPAETSCLVIVDSIRKLVPEGIFKRVVQAMKEDEKGKGKDAKPKGAFGKKNERKGVDGYGGRAAQIKAALNASWMDELVPLLDDTGTGLIAIARETKKGDATIWEQRSGEDVNVGGGAGLYYDASYSMRVQLASYVTDGDGQEGNPKRIYGERHLVTIRKTKVAGRREKYVRCYFHTSNGNLVPAGFDRARDVLELAKKFGIVTGTTWLHWARGGAKWQGEHNAVKKLTAEPAMLVHLERDVRAVFQTHAAEEYDEEGVIS